MVKKRKTAAPGRLKRNPVARSLSSPLFRARVVERPDRSDRPRQQSKHRKRLKDEADE